MENGAALNSLINVMSYHMNTILISLQTQTNYSNVVLTKIYLIRLESVLNVFLALSLNFALYRTDSYNRKMENIFKCELLCTNLDMVLKNKGLHPWMVSNCYFDCFWLKFCSRNAIFLWMRMATGNVFEELISQWYATHFTILTPKFLWQRIS